MSFQRSHGGARRGSGRRPRNQTWGGINERGGLHNFFSTTRNQNQVNPTVQLTDTTRRDERVVVEEVGSEDESDSPVRGNGIETVPIPNDDADEPVADEANLHEKGKKIRNSENLCHQRECIESNEYYEKAYKNIRSNGTCWDIPPTIVKKVSSDAKTCWKDFFKLRVFNFIPQAMIGEHWRPKCPCCKRKMTRHAKDVPPRLVFDQFDNYWLNAPDRYRCDNCIDYNNSIKDDPTKEKRQVTHVSTNDAIMTQIQNSFPEVTDAFPCYLTKKNAIDKKLMETVVHNAVKGVGPHAMAENIVAWHQLHWQKQELQWARSLIKRLAQPSLTPIIRSDIEKCPHYFSEALGGCTPSGQWLVDILCTIIEENRPYYDSECIKRAILSKILAIDASYKVPKWMMLWGVSRIYEALLSGTNEYNEVIFQCFSTSDNHQELGANLRMLESLGLNPYLAFTDDPGRDEVLLHEIFSNLRNGSDEKDTEDIPKDLVELQSEKKILYLYRYQDALDTLSRFRNDLETELANSTNQKVKISLDAEWPVLFEGDQSNRKKRAGNVNIVQLGSNVTDYTIILELYNFKNNQTRIKAIGQKLKAIFSLPVSAIVGQCHVKDLNKLNNQYHFDLPDNSSIMDDVSTMAMNRGLTTRGKEQNTLQALCRGQGMYIPKPQGVRVGSLFGSTNGNLNERALKYCQLDVEAPLKLHSIYAGLPDLTKRVSHINLPIGTKVDIMPSAKAKDPIAQGIVKQIGGKWKDNKMKLRRNMMLVEVNKVFKGRGVIHYPSCKDKEKKCSCGRRSHDDVRNTCDFYLYSQFGPPPFVTAEISSRLRLSNEAISYPNCIYADGDDVESHIAVQNFTQGTEDNVELVDGGTRADVGVANEDGVVEDPDDGLSDADDNASVDDDDDCVLPPQLYDLFDDDDDEPPAAPAVAPKPREVKKACDVEFNKVLEEIIAGADRLAEADKQKLDSMAPDEGDLPLDELPLSSEWKTVLGDLFHFMDRAKLPMHHEYKGLFFRSLRAAMFIMNSQDVEDVKRVLESKENTSWEEKLAYNFDYIARRVRRRVPPANILYQRMKAVYDFFKDKVDSKTEKVLFHTEAKKKFENMLELVKKGFGSDPEGLSLYVPKTDKYGKQMIDADGLPLYRSLRGTSNLESLHQYLTTSFGHTASGPRYSDCLLTLVRHFFNWRMSLKNRPGFPKLLHYDGRLIDRINNYYELIFGYPKYKEWMSFNEALPLESPYGIVKVQNPLTSSTPLSQNDRDKLKKNTMLHYLARRQQCSLPVLPIRGENEKKLVYQKMKDIVEKNENLDSYAVVEQLTKDWNENEVSIEKKIYPKLPSHFIKYIKQWRKNQSTRDAALASGANRLSAAVEYVPATQDMQNFEPVGFSEQNIAPTETVTHVSATATTPTDEEVLDTVVEPPPASVGVATRTQPPTEVEQPPPRRRKTARTRTCKGPEGKGNCPQPLTCSGRSNRNECILSPTRGQKRKSPTVSGLPKTCQVCKTRGCPGSEKRHLCTNKRRSNT